MEKLFFSNLGVKDFVSWAYTLGKKAKPTKYRDYKLAQFLNLSISFDYCIPLLDLVVERRNEFYGDKGFYILILIN